MGMVVINPNRSGQVLQAGFASLMELWIIEVT